MHERCSSLSASSLSADVASCSRMVTVPAQLLDSSLTMDKCHKHLTGQFCGSVTLQFFGFFHIVIGQPFCYISSVQVNGLIFPALDSLIDGQA